MLAIQAPTIQAPAIQEVADEHVLGKIAVA